MPRALVYIVPVALAVYALFDLRGSDATDRAGFNPWGWAAVIVLLPVVGPLTWILVSRSRRAGGSVGTRPTTGPSQPGPRPGGTPGRRPGRRPGPVAPDDDPEVLWRLEQQQRRAGHRETRPPTPPVEDGTTKPAQDDDPAV